MGFVEAIKSFYGRYTDFSTRSSRSEYWWMQLFILLTLIVLAIIVGLLGGFSSSSGELSPLLMGVFGIWWLAHIIPSIAIQVRRFHDQDKSGWFVLLGFIPYVGGIVVFVFMLLKGTDGPNRFGEDPLGSIAHTFS